MAPNKTAEAKILNLLVAISRELIVLTGILIRFPSNTIGNSVVVVICDPLAISLRFNKKGK